MLELLYPVAVVLLGYIVLGMTGFGSALIIVPLLAWHWPLPEVVALTLLLDVPASMLMGGLNISRVNWVEMRRLLPGMVAGILAALWLAGMVEPRWPLVGLGVYVIAVGVRNLTSATHSKGSINSVYAYPVGAAIGAVEMLFGTAGPLVVAWLSRRLSDVHALRATTPLVITLSACSVLLTMGMAGRLSDPELWWRWIVLLGVAVIGVLIGHSWSRRVAPFVVRKTICVLLLGSGLSLVIHALFRA